MRSKRTNGSRHQGHFAYLSIQFQSFGSDQTTDHFAMCSWFPFTPATLSELKTCLLQNPSGTCSNFEKSALGMSPSSRLFLKRFNPTPISIKRFPEWDVSRVTTLITVSPPPVSIKRSRNGTFQSHVSFLHVLLRHQFQSSDFGMGRFQRK